MPKSDRYTRVKELSAKKMTERMADPLDFLLLSELPEEGSVMGFHVLGATVSSIKEKYEGLTPDLISGRLRSMLAMGLTKEVTVIPVSRGKGWQITKAGQKILAGWKKQHKENDGTAK